MADDHKALTPVSRLEEVQTASSEDMLLLSKSSGNGVLESVKIKIGDFLDTALSGYSNINKWIQGKLDDIYDSIDNGMFVKKNADIDPGTKPKITYDEKGLVTGGDNLLSDDIPDLDASKITTGTFDANRIPKDISVSTANKAKCDVNGNDITSTYATQTSVNSTISTLASKTELSDYVKANSRIDKGTATKIIYDEKGLVTNGESLSLSDLPKNITDEYISCISASKITGKLTQAQLPDVITITGTVEQANKDGNGNIITATYATKDELASKANTSDLTAYLTTDNASSTYATKSELTAAQTTLNTTITNKMPGISHIEVVDAPPSDAAADVLYFIKQS